MTLKTSRSRGSSLVSEKIEEHRGSGDAGRRYMAGRLRRA